MQWQTLALPTQRASCTILSTEWPQPRLPSLHGAETGADQSHNAGLRASSQLQKLVCEWSCGQMPSEAS